MNELNRNIVKEACYVINECMIQPTIDIETLKTQAYLIIREVKREEAIREVIEEILHGEG